MDVRIWGVVDDRLIEICVAANGDGGALRIDGLPEGRIRSAADRVRAALLNSRVVKEPPAVAIRAEPTLMTGTTSDLDLGFALAALASVGIIGTGLRSVLAVGRLGLDGAVYARDLVERASLSDVVASLCRTPVLEYEHMFEREIDR